MINSTYLDIQKSDDEYRFGRDFIAHAVRWSVLQNVLINESKRLNRPIIVYDVGCGRKMPLAQALFSNRHYDILHSMWCFDQIIDQTRNFTVKGQQRVFPIIGDFCSTYKNIVSTYPPDVIVSFEAFEHMPISHAWQFIRDIRTCCQPHTVFYFSTPNYKHTRGAAKNHQNECSIELLTAVLENCMFKVEKINGLYCELKRAEEYCINNNIGKLYFDLKERFENEILSMLFAWNIPDKSKSVMYVCTPTDKVAATDQDVIDLAMDPMFRQMTV